MAGSGSSLLDLLQIQVGEETTWGTAVAATAKLMGVEDLTLMPGVKGKVFHDRRGSLAPGYLAELLEIMPTGKMPMIASYQDICYVFDNLLGEATPSGVGPYTRDYAGPLGTVPTPKILTMIYGDATNCYKLAGGLISKATFKGSSGSNMAIETELMGKVVTTGSLAALSDRVVNVAMGDHMAVYIDAWGGTMGATIIACTAYEYELTIDAKRKGDLFLGSLTACNYHEDDGADGWDVMLKLSLELNAVSKAQLDALISTSAIYQRQIRLKSTSGTNVIQFDVAGTSEESPDIFTSRDGVVTFETQLKGTYNTGLANYLKIQSINGVSALP